MPSGLQFPVPFAGISHMVEFDTPEDFAAALAHITTCHGHNIAIEGGRWTGKPAIWGSEMAIFECLKPFLEERKRQSSDPYDQAQTFFMGVLREWFDSHTSTRRRDMPNNIALDLRRALQRSGLTLSRVIRQGED